MSQRQTWWILAAILLVGIVGRGYQLEARSLWFDEAFSWRLVQFPWAELIERDILDVHPPLYYVLLKGWAVVFGSSVLALRSFSVLLAGVTIALVYGFTSYAFYSRRAGLIAALLVAIAGFQIQAAWEARMYTLGTVLSVATTWLLLRLVREEKPVWVQVSGYGVAVALFAYVHYYALFSLAAQVFFIVGYLVASTRGRLGEILQWRLTWRLAAAGLVAAALYAPWVPYFLQQNSQVQAAFWIPPLTRWSVVDTLYRSFFMTDALPRFTGRIGVLWSLLPACGVVGAWLWLAAQTRWRQRARDAHWLVVLSAVIPFAASLLVSLLSQSLYQDRFFVFAHLFVVISVAVVLESVRFPVARATLLLVVITGILIANVQYWRALQLWAKPGAQAATRALFAEHQAGEPVVASSPFIFFPVLHYTEEEFADRAPVKLYSPTGATIHFAGGPILKADDTVDASIFTEGHQPLWVVDTTGFGSAPLRPPAPWRATYTASFAEVFGYQGEVAITKYERLAR